MIEKATAASLAGALGRPDPTRPGRRKCLRDNPRTGIVSGDIYGTAGTELTRGDPGHGPMREGGGPGAVTRPRHTPCSSEENDEGLQEFPYARRRDRGRRGAGGCPGVQRLDQ